MKTSMSISKGRGNQKHNTRTQKTTQKNVDSSRTHLNQTIVNSDIREVYHELFDDSLKKYNAKQKRNDRKIKDYYQKIANSKQEKAFHELVVQIGNTTDQSEIEHVYYKNIYHEFVEVFEKKNPQMKIIGAYIHLDEATPHLHLDYVPFAKNQKRGLETRVSNDLAIKQMGYKNWSDWKDKQFESLEKICGYYNIEREHMNNTSYHLSVDSYKKEQRMIDKLQEQLNDMLESTKSAPVEQIEPHINKITKKKTVPYEAYLDVLEQNSDLNVKIDSLKKQNMLQKAKISSLESKNEKNATLIASMRKKPYIQKNEALEASVNKLTNENKRVKELASDEAWQKARKFYREQIDQRDDKIKELSTKVELTQDIGRQLKKVTDERDTYLDIIKDQQRELSLLDRIIDWLHLGNLVNFMKEHFKQEKSFEDLNDKILAINLEKSAEELKMDHEEKLELKNNRQSRGRSR